MKTHQYTVTITFDLVSAEKRPQLAQVMDAVARASFWQWAQSENVLSSAPSVTVLDHDTLAKPA